MNKNQKIGAMLLVALVLVGAGYSIANPPKKASAELKEKLNTQYVAIPTDAGKASFTKQSENMSKEVGPVLLDLDSQIISCAPNVDGVMSASHTTGGSCIAAPTSLSNVDGLYMSGQCCGAMMDTKEYTEELEKMQKYKDIPDVPLNPYKTPITVAKQWIDYDNATTLSASEQAVMDEAMKLSKEGPCCCKCWHYFVNKGIAKKLIKDHDYSGQQVAEYWDSSSIC